MMPFEALLQAFTNAVATGDRKTFVSLFTPDGAYDDGFFGLHRGREAIGAMLDRFHEGGEMFRWQFFDPLASDALGYARYTFSYRSKQPESSGQLIVFEGMSRLRLEGGLIADYAEVFDRGMAFVQLGYETPRVRKLLDRYAREWRASERVQQHLAWREGQAR